MRYRNPFPANRMHSSKRPLTTQLISGGCRGAPVLALHPATQPCVPLTSAKDKPASAKLTASRIGGTMHAEMRANRQCHAYHFSSVGRSLLTLKSQTEMRLLPSVKHSFIGDPSWLNGLRCTICNTEIRGKDSQPSNRILRSA